MEIVREDLDRAATDGLITARQAEELWAGWKTRERVALAAGAPPAGPRFDFVHVLYYFGALIVIGAMGFFMNLGWESFGGQWICLVSCAYAAVFVFIGRGLWDKEGLRTPAGLLITIAVSMTPLAIYGLERWLNLWPEIAPVNYRDFYNYLSGGWFAMEISTLVAGALALRFFRFPFLVAPSALILWFLSMDLVPLVVGKEFTWADRAWVSVVVGLVILLLAFLVDRRTRQDFAFWLYFFGMLAFWGGLTSMDSGSQLGKAIYCLINLGLMWAGVLLDRRVFVVFGGLGVAGYLGYLSHDVFKNSMAFPFVLSSIGIGVIVAGIQFQRHRKAIEAFALATVPLVVRQFLPRERT